MASAAPAVQGAPAQRSIQPSGRDYNAPRLVVPEGSLPTPWVVRSSTLHPSRCVETSTACSRPRGLDAGISTRVINVLNVNTCFFFGPGGGLRWTLVAEDLAVTLVAEDFLWWQTFRGAKAGSGEAPPSPETITRLRLRRFSALGKRPPLIPP